MIRLTFWRPLFAVLTLFLLTCLPGSVPSAFAQATSTGTVTGTVTDASGALIEGATITVVDIATKAKLSATTNKDGQYVLPNVPPSTYSISATKSGFATDQITGQPVGVGAQTTANFRLAIGSESTTIEVQASNADLQTLNSTVGESVDPVMVDSLPAIGRDVSSFASFQPGVTPGGSVAGTVSDQAVITLDGGSNSSDMDGNMQQYTGSFGNSTTGGFLGAGSSGVMPMPQDSVEEFRVSTSGQTADFNNSSGSQSQIVTKRGRDRWTGTVYEYYLDSNIGANKWENNFQSLYTPKPSYHYSRFGVAGGGPIAPWMLGGKTYLFVNYEGFRYPQSQTYERAVPSAAMMAGNLTFNGVTYTADTLKADDPRHLGLNASMKNFWATQLPQQGGSYAGVFDPSCGPVSASYCDGVNTIGYKANVRTPQSSNFGVARVDHDFGSKWHLMASYRYFKLTQLTTNQVDIGGAFAGDTLGVPAANANRPQDPWFFVVGLTTNISSSLTNDFHYSYLRNNWQWKDNNAPPQLAGAGGALEPLGESASTVVLAPYNVDTQDVRTRIWNGKDNFISDNLTKLKGDHLIQFGGQFQHNFNYHQRSDNGNNINYTTTYQIGDASGAGLITFPGLNAGGLGAVTSNTNNARLLAAYYGMVTDTQVGDTYTYTKSGLTLNAPQTSIGASTSVPYYNLYATDTWHMKPSLTLNYGLSYAIEMPPHERNGNQVMWVDTNANPIRAADYLAARASAAAQGASYNPETGFALINNVQGGRKYPYNPYYGSVSPRVSLAWNPNFQNSALRRIFGDGSTVIRGGYGRIYGRINGDLQVLNPLLSPSIFLAVQCRTPQSDGTCNATGFNDGSVFRFGSTANNLDGLSAPLASAPATAPQPYFPGYNGPGVSIASPLDPSLRPNSADTFNLSIQRQINRKMLVEVGYIGRLIHNEYIMVNPNAVPYMFSKGGQTFAAAYAAVETAFGCASSASACSLATSKATAKTPVLPNVSPQPFFESALGGVNSAYCSGFASCTAAVVHNQASNFGSQKVFALWSALDNGAFNFSRTMMNTPIPGSSFGSAGQLGSGLTVGTSSGYSNYNGGYVTFKTTNFRGLTLQENLTYSKALGLNAYAQSTSGSVANDSFDIHKNYGVQSFDQKLIFNTFIVYQTPWYKHQEGIVGRLAGGWTISPVIVAGTGQPLTCTTNAGSQSFGGADGSNLSDKEQCVFTKPYTGGYHTHRGVAGGQDAINPAINVGTTVKGPGPAAINMFADPVAVYDTVRPTILGIDEHGGGTGPIRGLGYLNVDLSIKKTLMVWERSSLEFSGIMFNALNHLDFANPSLSIATPASFGVTRTQGNQPRQIQMGLRASF
ncbi:carboxypeptidase regulatory-like domain-containing protein [Granulicella sp. WH15]|uniref:carboxypeptidase-like regulatory domain-containing protein n=1 Tax=Granulicella sp. WH15 TaxID=2602070 RepID=UPI001366C7E9|nr:carboxypeptidase-like regulatory domain-containing protein [Granulicella sp. WH15]QHN04587.1 carboxypeptidase regulatory-like domain-containing protein [Granulicella sp. WH15]